MTHRTFLALGLAASALVAQTPTPSVMSKNAFWMQFGKKASDTGGIKSNFMILGSDQQRFFPNYLPPTKRIVITDIVVSGRRALTSSYTRGVQMNLRATISNNPPNSYFQPPYGAMAIQFPAGSSATTVSQHFSTGLVFTAPDLPFLTFSLSDGTGVIPAGIENDFDVYAQGYFVDK